jgi:hypothetical protein
VIIARSFSELPAQSHITFIYLSDSGFPKPKHPFFILPFLNRKQSTKHAISTGNLSPHATVPSHRNHVRNPAVFLVANRADALFDNHNGIIGSTYGRGEPTVSPVYIHSTFEYLVPLGKPLDKQTMFNLYCVTLFTPCLRITI